MRQYRALSRTNRPAAELVAAREQLLADAACRRDAAWLREAWRALHEFWLAAEATRIGAVAGSGFAIVATGSLGRRELLPHSDLDLLLVHDGQPAELVGKAAEALWYPLWDANIRLDHSVRTVAETLEVAAVDLPAALAMLDARHIAGDEQLSAQLIRGVRDQWRNGIRSRYHELVTLTHARWNRSGEIPHRAEPDLKCGRGGLRDAQLLDALAIAQVTDRFTVGDTGTLGGAYRLLLDVRTELRRVSGRGQDLLLAQYADEIGAALHIGDRYELARELSEAARTVSDRVAAGLRTAANALPRRQITAVRPRLRRPLDDGVIEYAGEVVLAREARPGRDPALVLRVAAASAATGLPIAAATLDQLAATAAELHTPWPPEALANLLALLSAGPTIVPTIEALDRVGLWGRLLPEWGAVRDLPPRDGIHVWTVDRHLVETVVRAGVFTTSVARPDLLILAALLHDIGKGRGSDHSVIGAELVSRIGVRLGLRPSDAERLTTLVRHHLLLTTTATRHDLNDPGVIAKVCEALDGDAVLLEVLHAMTEADALATGPTVWSEWKASLVADLVRRCRSALAGDPPPHADPVDPEYVALAARPGVRVEVRPAADRRLHHVVMIAPDQPGVLSKAAGVLALNSLRVHYASVNVHAGTAINDFVVAPQFGPPPPAQVLREQFGRALDGDIDLLDSLDARELRGSQLHHAPAGSAPPRVRWFDGAGDRLIVEIRAADRVGLLARLTGALEKAGVDIAWAKVSTVGLMVDDVFCLVSPNPATRTDVERQVFAVLGGGPCRSPVVGALPPESPTPAKSKSR